ncbi:ankyrin repeat-containing domain protein, partial [Chytriomyces cf. hyalinus JEL632]
ILTSPDSAINNTDRSGRTPLFRVSGTGDVNAVTALIRAGADVNAKDNAGWSPIHEACIEGQLQTATLLISYGADVNALGFDNQTPLHDAVGANHYEVVELLLSHGASLTAVNKEGQTPMDDVEDETMLQILNLWKRMTAKVLEVDEHGITLLHQYAMKGELKHVKRVLKYGAEVDFACNAGWTPLHEAASKGYSSIVEELCRYGADLNPRSRASVSSSSNPLLLGKGGDVVPHGVTPLMDAASGCFVETVRLLLEFGADPEMSDSSGKLARDYVPEFTASENAKAAAEVMQLLNRPASSWTPVRKPDFVKSKIGTGGMMAHIRDQASAMLAKNEAAMGSKDPR